MEESKKQVLKECLGKASRVVMILAIAGMVANFCAIIPFFGVVTQMCNIVIIACFVSFSEKLDLASALLSEPDAAAVKKIRLGILFFVLAFILIVIPVAGKILAMISFVVSYIFMMMGFNALKKSETFPLKDGISFVSTAMLLGVIGSVLSIIPIIGIVGKIILIVSFLLILLGWKKVVADTIVAAAVATAEIENKAPESPAE